MVARKFLRRTTGFNEVWSRDHSGAEKRCVPSPSADTIVLFRLFGDAICVVFSYTKNWGSTCSIAVQSGSTIAGPDVLHHWQALASRFL